jgi:hypothetical protein
MTTHEAPGHHPVHHHHKESHKAGNTLKILAIVAAFLGSIAGYTPFIRMIIRDVIREELRAYETKGESQMRWEASREEANQLRGRYEAEMVEIRRRLGVIENHIWRRPQID